MNDLVVSFASSMLSMRCTSFAVPSVATTRACVCPRVKSAEPWARGSSDESIEMLRTTSGLRPSTRSPVSSTCARSALYSMSPTIWPTRPTCAGSRTVAISALTSSFTFSTAWMRVALSFWLIAASMRFSAAFVTVFLTSSGISVPVHAIFSGRSTFLRSSSCIVTSSPIPFCATLSASTISASETSSAPPSTIMIESAEPATIMSMSENSSAWKVGLSTHFPSTRPTRTPAIGPAHGILLALSANEVAMSPSTSWSFSWSAEST